MGEWETNGILRDINRPPRWGLVNICNIPGYKQIAPMGLGGDDVVARDIIISFL